MTFIRCYLVIANNRLKTTLGIPILILILRVLNILALYTPLANPPESIESGNYGQPPSALWWFKQSVIYFIGLLGMKIVVFFLIQLLPFIVKIGDWALSWTEGNTAVQIFFVMLLFPVIMNALQYYIIDTFIKKPLAPLPEPLTPEDEFDDRDDDHHHGELLPGLEDEQTFVTEGDALDKGDGGLEHGARNKTIDSRKSSEHDLPIDEDTATVSSGPASSSSSHGEYENGMSSSTKLTAQPKDS